MLDEARKSYEGDLPKTEKPTESILFTDFMREWLGMIKSSVEMSTYGSYSFIVEKRIIPYFEDKNIEPFERRLIELRASQDKNRMCAEKAIAQIIWTLYM